MGDRLGFEQVPLAQVRDYWDRRPCNLRHSPRAVGTCEYFDEVEKRKYLVEPHIPRFAEFERWRGKRVLEIGCGIGTDTVNFARHGADVVAMDISRESLAIAQQRAEVFGLADRIRFVQGNAEELRSIVPAERFDLIYSFGVIHHTPHPDRVFAALPGYAGPGTVVKVMLYHRRSWKVFWIVLAHGRGRFWKTSELVARHSEAQTGCPVTYTYTRRQGSRLLEGAGFRVRSAAIEHIFPYRIADYVRYRYVKVWYFRWLPTPVFRWFERLVGWHLCLTAVAP